MSKVVLVASGFSIAGVAIITAAVGIAQAVSIQPHDEAMSKEIAIVDLSETTSSEELSSSISLSPGMYIPSQEYLYNQPADKEDVIKTMNLGAISEASALALEEIVAGAPKHLGYELAELSSYDSSIYEENVKYFSNLISEVSESAITADEVNVEFNKFTDWVKGFKSSVDLQQEEKLVVLDKVQEPVLTEEVVEVEEATPATFVSYGIPKLGRQYLTYMGYHKITAKTTPHYRLQQVATTNEEGYRVYQDAICIALASSYGTTIGTLYDITFEDGKTMRAILGDNKSDKHTDTLKQYRDSTEVYDGSSGNILEIIFDVDTLGTMDKINKKINSDYPAHIISIIKVGMAEGFGG